MLLFNNIYSKHKETIYNFLWRSFQIFTKQGIILFIFIICSKNLSKQDFGVYNYIVAFVLFLIMLGDFGISTATSKYVAEYNYKDKTKIKSILVSISFLIFLISTIIIILSFLFSKYILNDKYFYFLYLLPLIILVPLTSLYDGIYRGLKKFKELSIISFVIGIISLIFSYFFIKNYELMGALISQNLFYFITLIGLFICYKDFSLKIDYKIIKEVGSYSIVYGLAAIGYYLFAKIDIIILGHYNFINEIAIYELLNKIFWVMLFPFAIIGQIVAPNFSRLHAQNNYNEIYKKLKKYTIFFFSLAVIFSFIVYFLIPPFIKIFYNNYYGQLFFSILPLSIFIFLIQISTSSIDSGIIVPTGYASIMTIAYLILGFSNIILALILLYFFGYIGVIWATLISSLIMVLYVRVKFFKKLKNYIYNKNNY